MSTLRLSKPDANTTLLLLVRHGATEANLRRPYILQGRTLNGPLSETGRQQVAQARDYLQSVPIDHFYASPLIRAQQSAEIIAEPHGHCVKAVEQIAEVDVGEWESKSWDIIEAEHPNEYRLFMENPALNPYKGGETYQDVRDRVVPAFHELAAQHLGEIIVTVAHNVVNRSLLADLLQLDLRFAKDIKQNNACVNVLRYRNGKLNLITLNGVFHLDEM